MKHLNRTGAVLICAAAPLAMAGVSQAAMVSYEFTSGSATAKIATVSPGANLTASDVAGHGSWGFGDKSTAYMNLIYVGGTDAAGAVAASDYFQFTITPDAGHPLNLSSLSFDYGYSYSSGHDNNDTLTYFVRSDAESPTFATDLAGSVQSVTFPGQTTSYVIPLTSTGPITLGSSYQNLTGPVTFRLYVYNSQLETVSHSEYARVDNVVVTTAAPVPEPASLSLLALAGLVAWPRRKRA